MKGIVLVLIVIIMTLVCEPAFCQDILATQGAQWSGNGHYYKAVLVPDRITWDEANKEAREAGGHLATISSVEENRFVYDLFKGDIRYWFVGSAGNIEGPWLGAYQPEGSTEPAGGWTWVTGESFSYTNWASNQPDNAQGRESRLHFWNWGSLPSPTWNDHTDSFATSGYIIEWEQKTPVDTLHPQGQIIQIPIDRNGGRSSILPSNPLYLNVDGVDYALGGVMYANSPDCPGDAAGSELPQEIAINLRSLGLKNVETVYMATEAAWGVDLPNGIRVGEVIFDYEEGGPSTRLDLKMGENIAEWCLERPGIIAYHSMPPIISSFSDESTSHEYMGHTYAASIRLDATRTLSRIRLNVVDANSLLAYRKTDYEQRTWIATAIMALTLEGEMRI